MLAQSQSLTRAADVDDGNEQEQDQEEQRAPEKEGEPEDQDQVDRGGEGGETTETAETKDAEVVVDYPPEAGAAAVAIQTAWRGFSARKAYEEEVVTRQWAAVKVQSFFRSRRARRVFAKHMRWVDGWVGEGGTAHFVNTCGNDARDN